MTTHPRQFGDQGPSADRRAAEHSHTALPHIDQKPQDPHEEHQSSGWGHRLMMLVCCIPMLLLVIALVASGTAGGTALLFPLLCIAMMAAMMFFMPGDHRH